MKKWLSVSLVALTLLSLNSAWASPQQDAMDAYVPLYTKEGRFTCGATAVGKHAIVTAEHCVLDDQRQPEQLFRKDGSPVEVIGGDGQEHVLACVAGDKLKPVKLAKQLSVGAKVFMYGKPLDLDLIYREGYLSGQVHDPENRIWYFFDLMIGPGDSGSGIFDGKGRLVGTVSIVFHQIMSPFHLAGIQPYNFSKEQWEAAALCG